LTAVIAIKSAGVGLWAGQWYCVAPPQNHYRRLRLQMA